MTTTLLRSPRSNSAGQTRLPTFSMNSTESGPDRQRLERAAHHLGIQVATRPGVDLHRTRAGRPDPFGVEQCLLVALR